MAYKDSTFDERRSAAANAKKATIERYLGKPGADDPAVIQQHAARKAVEEAREVRVAERKAARAADAARQIAEQKAQAAEKAAHEVENVARKLAQEAERKAARDARYAARKARK
jgi:preprotein translocase subunit SecD